MKAYLITGLCTNQVSEYEIPVPKDDEVMIKVMAAGLCGTDAHIFKGEYYGSYPIIPGHEFSGVIESVGKNVTNFKVGDRVTADPNIFCDNCIECKSNRQNFCKSFRAAGVTYNGAMAQFMVIPERCVFPIFDIDFTSATMIEPLACCIHGQNLLQPKLAISTLIIGAGPIGLLHLQLSKMNGSSHITVCDIKTDRLELAKKLGADTVCTPDELDKTYADGFDVVIESTGVPSVAEKSLKYVRNMGKLLLFGVCPAESTITINPYEIFRRELTILSSFALRKTFSQSLDLVRNNRIDLKSLIGNKVTLDKMPQVMDNFINGKTNMKTVVYPNGIE